MVKISYFGYTTYELNDDLSTGRRIMNRVPQGFEGFMYKSVGGCLRSLSHYIGFVYHKNDWCFEEEVTPKGKDAWVLHIIIDKWSHKLADEKMIANWKKNGNPELIDIIVNVAIDKV